MRNSDVLMTFDTPMHGGLLPSKRMIAARAIAVPATDAEERLPWSLAAPLIGGLSLGLWVGIWQLARLALGG